MLLPGKRVKLTKWIHGSRCVLRVQVEGVIPDARPGEPVLEPATVRWLDDLQRLADAGDVEQISKTTGIGDVYVRRSA